MDIIKYLVIVTCFCGLLLSCSNDPQQKTVETVPDKMTAVDTSSTSITTIKKDTTPPLSNKNIDSTAQAVEKAALAALETRQKEETEKEIAAKEEARAAKEEAAREKRRAKRRAERKKKREAEARAKANAEAGTKQEEVKRKKNGKPNISFEKMVHNYGRISQGEKVKHNFTFKNTGSSELVISNATASCGCTQPSFPFVPISPGEEGYIGVVFDSKGRLGRQKPKVTITTNASPATYDIYLEGTVDSEEVEENKEEEKGGAPK